MALKLMTVDDSATIRRIVGSCAREMVPDVEVIEAEDGRDCLEQVAQRAPDVIILDVNMPVMDGETCLERLKADPATAEIPVVMLTTESEKRLVLRLLKLGIAQYMIKPFDREEFQDKVGGLLMSAVADRAPTPEPTLNVPVDDYVLILEAKEKIVDTLRAGLEAKWKPVVTADPETALEYFTAKAPKMVVADLGLPAAGAFDIFAQMRRVPERQQVVYVGTCLKTANELLSRARATGYIVPLTKPFGVEEVRRLADEQARHEVTTRSEGDVFVIAAAQGCYYDQDASIRQAIERAADEGFTKVVIDLSAVSAEDLEQLAVWQELHAATSSLELQASYVAPGAKIEARLHETPETEGIVIHTSADDAFGALAA